MSNYVAFVAYKVTRHASTGGNTTVEEEYRLFPAETGAPAMQSLANAVDMIADRHGVSTGAVTVTNFNIMSGTVGA